MGNPRASASVALLSRAMRAMAFKDAKILELGCGDGSLVVEVANALGIRDVYGVDIDEVALKKAEDRGVKVFKADLNSDPYLSKMASSTLY